MSISAIAKKRLAFHKDDGGFISVKPGEFVSLPDYVRKDPMFHWAVKDGVLVVSEQVITPVEPPAKVPAKVPEKVEEAPVEEAPVEEAPVEEAPVEEAPVEEAPASKKKTTTKKKAADK